MLGPSRPQGEQNCGFICGDHRSRPDRAQSEGTDSPRPCNRALPRLRNTHQELENGFFLLLLPVAAAGIAAEPPESSPHPCWVWSCWSCCSFPNGAPVVRRARRGRGAAAGGAGADSGDHFPSFCLNSAPSPFRCQSTQEVEGERLLWRSLLLGGSSGSGKRFLSSRSAQMEPGQLRGSQSPPPPPSPPVSWSWSRDKEPGTGRWEPPRSPGTGRCQRGEHSQLLLLISTLDPSRILPLLTPRLWASFPSYCWIREWFVAGSLPSAHPTRPGRGEILPVEFSPWIFAFSPQKCRWFQTIAPHADILELGRMKRPRRSCGCCSLTPAFPAPQLFPLGQFLHPREGIPAFHLRGIPLETSPLQGHKETDSADWLKGLFVLPCLGPQHHFQPTPSLPFISLPLEFSRFSHPQLLAGAVPRGEGCKADFHPGALQPRPSRAGFSSSRVPGRAAGGGMGARGVADPRGASLTRLSLLAPLRPGPSAVTGEGLAGGR